MITLAIIYDHRGRTRRGDEGPVEVRITYNRKLYYVKTGVRVRRSEFAHGAIVNRSDSFELNERIALLTKAIEREVTSYIKSNRAIDVSEIRRSIYGDRPSESRSMLDWIRDEIGRLNVSDGTLRHYQLLLKRLEQYGVIQDWHDLTVENIYRFDEWLRTLPRQLGDARTKMGETATISAASVHNYHKNFKALLYRASEFGKIDQNPYTKLRGKFLCPSRDKTDYLTDAEMRDFMALPLKAGTPACVARDLFVIQMYTGLSYSDMQSLDIRDYTNIGGVWKSVRERTKTGVPYISQLLPPVVEVLERYGMQVPKMNNADYNRMLKAIGAVAGIDKRIHSHMGRHTFATWMLSHGASIENVSQMLGHTNITQTQRYAKVLAQSVHEDFDRMSNLLKKEQYEK